MANFFDDNEDIRFLFNHLDLGRLAALTEEEFRFKAEFDFAPGPDLVKRADPGPGQRCRWCGAGTPHGRRAPGWVRVTGHRGHRRHRIARPGPRLSLILATDRRPRD